VCKYINIKLFSPYSPESNQPTAPHTLPASQFLAQKQKHSSSYLPYETFYISILVLIMAFTMPTFINRLMRPFTTTTRLSLNPESSISFPEGAQKATVAAGCFWGVEHMFRKEFKGKGLYDARVGYIGGNTQSPSYRAVCSGQTGRTYPNAPSHLPSKSMLKEILQMPKPCKLPTTHQRLHIHNSSNFSTRCMILRRQTAKVQIRGLSTEAEFSTIMMSKSG
jgi:Peptide methionine sulfoxide reductase